MKKDKLEEIAEIVEANQNLDRAHLNEDILNWHNQQQACLLKDLVGKVEKRISYENKYRKSDYNSGFTPNESGPCCKKCKMINPINPLHVLVNCKNPFQMKKNYAGGKLCQCHIPFRKVAVKVKINTLSDLLKLIKEIEV